MGTRGDRQVEEGEAAGGQHEEARQDTNAPEPLAEPAAEGASEGADTVHSERRAGLGNREAELVVQVGRVKRGIGVA